MTDLYIMLFGRGAGTDYLVLEADSHDDARKKAHALSASEGWTPQALYAATAVSLHDEGEAPEGGEGDA